MTTRCPLYPQKRTLVERVGMSALCQKRTSWSLPLPKATSPHGRSRVSFAECEPKLSLRQSRGPRRGRAVLGANEAQVAHDFIAAALVRRMVDAIDHRHVGKIKRAHAF